MKTRTKIALLLVALTVSITASANTQASESVFSKKAIHSLIKQNIDSTLDALLDDFKIPDASIAPVKPIAPIISKVKTDNEALDENLNSKKRNVKTNQIG